MQKKQIKSKINSALSYVGIAGILALTPVAALAAFNVGDQLGVDETAIRKALTGAGYQVVEFELEDGEVEVEAFLDGQLLELEVNPDTGEIMNIEIEEPDEDSDDDESDDDAVVDEAGAVANSGDLALPTV